MISMTCTTVDAAEISDEDIDEMEETVCVDTIVLCTSRQGRQIRCPLRLDCLVVFVTIRFSGVFVVPLYDYRNLFLI